MATEADIPATVCETRKEQGGNIAYDATNIVINKIPQEEKTQADTRDESPIVEGDNFLGTPSIGKVHCEVSNIAPDASNVAERADQTVKDATEILLPSKPKLRDQPLEFAGSEEISSERIQQNAEESNDSEKGEDRRVLPVEYSTYSGEMTSEMQAVDILHDPDLGDLRVETQLSKDTTSDHHRVNDSIAKQMVLSKENLQEASLPGGEKEFNIQVKATNDANGDGEKTEEDFSPNLTSDVSKEECPNDQGKMNPEQEGSDNENKIAENLDRIAEKAGQENSTLAHATSSSDEPLSKNESNSSFSQEDDMAVPTSEGSVILLESTMDESQVAVESQSRNLEGFVTTHGNTSITEKTEECSLVQVDGSEIQCDEQLEQESKELPVPEALTGGTNDNESAIIDKVKDEDEDLEEAEMHEIEKNKRINQQKEEAQVEKPVESLNVAPENVEASNLGQDFQEEHRTDGDQQGMMNDNSEEKTIDTVDTKKEILENFSTIVSIPPEVGSIDANLQEVASDSTSKKMIDELDTQMEVLEEFPTVANEEIEESSIVKVDDSKMKNEEHLEDQSRETPLPIPLAREASVDESTAEQETRIEDGEKAELCENETSPENMKIEPKIEKPENSLEVTSEDIKASSSCQEIETRDSAEEEGIAANPQGILDEKTDKEKVGATELKEEIPGVQSFLTNVSITPDEGSIDANLQEVTSDSTVEKMIDEVDTQKEVLEKFSSIVSNEEIEGNSNVKLDDSAMKNEEHLEKESIKTSSPIPLAREANDNESTAEQETPIEDGEKTELCETERSIENMKIELKIEKPENSLDVTSENIEASDSGQEVETRVSANVEGLAANPQGILDEKTDREIVGAAEIKEETLESFSTIVSTPPEEASIDANLQKATSDSTAEEMIDELNKQKEVLENFSTIVSNEYIEENLIVKVDDSEIKSEEHLEKESITTSSPIHLEREASDDGSTVEQETRIEGGEEAGLCENETSIENMKIESKIEKPENSLDVTSENIKASDSGQEIETRVSADEESLAANPQGILGENTDKEIVSAAGIKEETPELQNFAPIASNEKTNESSLIQGDGSQKEDEEHLQKESEKPSLIEDFTGNTNDDELTVTDDVKIEDETPRRPELFEEEKNIENALLKEELQKEKPVESSNATIEDFQVSDLGQHTEKTGVNEEQSLIENPQGNPGDVEKKTDTAETDEKTQELQNASLNVSNEDNDQSSIIQVDTSEMKNEEYLEREMQKPSLGEASTKDANDDKSTVMHEDKIGDENIRKVELFETEKNIDSTLPEKEDFQDASEVRKESTSSENIETTCYLKEHSLTANLQAITSDKTIDTTDAKENAAKTLPHEHAEGNSTIQLDCPQMKHGEHLDRECKIPPLIEAPIEETNEDKSKNTHEPNDGAEDPIKSELSENEKDAVSTSVKKEAHLEKPIDSLPVATEDIEVTDSIQDIEVSSIKEQILTAAQQEISGDKTEEKTIDAAETEETPDGQVRNVTQFDSLQVATKDIEATDSSQDIEIDSTKEQLQTADPQEMSGDKAEEKTTNAADTEEKIEIQDIATNVPNGVDEDDSPIKETGPQKPFLEEESMGNLNDDDSIIIHETKFEDESPIKTDLSNNEQNLDFTLAKEEVSSESSQAAEKINASASSQERETSSLEEQSLTTNPHGIMGDYNEDETNHVIGMKEESPEDKNVASTLPYEDIETRSLIQVDCSQKEHTVEKESNDPSVEKASTGDITESTLVEEELDEKCIDSLQVATQEIKASGSGQDIETSSIEEQILTTNQQETPNDEIEEKTIDAAYRNEETLEVQDTAANAPSGENDENSPIETDGSQKPFPKDASKRNDNGDESTLLQDAKFENEVLSEHEKNTEGSAVNEEVDTESIRVAVLPEDIKASPLVQDRETCLQEEQNLTPNPRGIKGDQEEDKTIDSTDLKEETPEDMNIAATTPRKDTGENSQILADCSEIEYEEHLVKESENPSLTEALEKDTEESASVKEEAEVEKLIDSSEVVSKNIKACASNQDAEISSIKEQILTEDPREISGDRSEEKSIDATAMNEEVLKNQDLATIVPDRDNEVNSTIEVDGSQKPSVGEASTGNANEDESKKAGASSEVENKELEPDTELPKEIENADIKAKTIEFNEEEGYLKDLQMATAVNVAAHEELVSDSIAVKIPSTKGLDANEEMVVDIAEDPNYKQEESSITKELEEHLLISHETVTNMTNLASEAPKLIGDYEVVAEAYSCGDKTDTEKAGELYDGSITITTNENPVETDKKESTDTETQAAKVEKDAELIQQDPEARTDQQDIEEDLPTKGSQDVSESNEVNAEEEKRNSDNCKEISGSTTDVELEDVSSSNVASDEVTTYNPYQDSKRQIQQEAENEEAQKQEEAVCRQEKVMSDETVEEIKVSISTTVASDFLPKSFKETSEVDHSATERELTMDKEGSHVGKAASGDNEETKIDMTNKEEEASKHKVSDVSSAALEETFTGKILGESNIFSETTNTTQSTVEDILVNSRSIGDLKENSDDEAPKRIELTPTTIKGQELESTTVEEISILISQGEGGEYEHAPSGSVTEEKLDSNEVELGHGENRSGYEPKNEVLESIAQVQNCDIVSEVEETRTCEENREATEIKRSNQAVADDTFEPKETINIDMSSKKIKEDDEYVEDYHGSLKEEVITESHEQDEINTEEIFEVVKKTNETEKVSKVLKEPDDKATGKTEENLVTNESIDRSLLGKSIEEVTTILDAKEPDEIDHVHIKTGTEDSRKEENLILSASEGKEEAQTCIEAERLGFSSNTMDTSEVSRSDSNQDIPEDSENSTSKNEYFEERYPNKSMESQMPAVSKDIELIEQVSEAKKITPEMQETRAATDSSAEPEATGAESQQVEETSHKCKGMAETSMSVEPAEVSTSKIVQEYVAGTSLEAEDNLTKIHDLPQESHVMDSVVKIAQKDGPNDLQIVRDITDQDVQELSEGSIAMINKENPMEGDPNENIEIMCSTDSIQKAPVLETLGKEMEEQQPGRTCEGVSNAKGQDCIEKNTVAHECNDLLEKSSSAVIETVSESNIHHSSAGDTAQTDKIQEGQMQIDFRPILPHTKCSDTETAEKDLPANFAEQYGTDEKELEGTPPPAKDKHVVLEADHTKNVNPKNSIGFKDTSVIEQGDSAERSQGEGETLKPSDFEQDAANFGHDEMTKSRENSESKEIDKQSLADLLQVSIKETSTMADHSAIEKEPTTHREDLHAEKTDEAEHEGTKTDEEKDDDEESSEQQRADVCSEAPVMVDVRDADAKVAHKKSHNILSGVGSKMKHSIAKVKKAITGKSSHSHPKPPSPK